MRGEAPADDEVLQLLLFAGNPLGDVKPLKKTLLQRSGTLSAVLGANPA